MTAVRRRSRKTRLFTLLVLFAGLYLVFSVLGRRQRRSNQPTVAPPAGKPAPASPLDIVDELVAPLYAVQAPEPEPELAPEPEPEPEVTVEALPFAAVLAIDEPLGDHDLPPVAAIAGRPPSPRRTKSRAGALLSAFTLVGVFALVALIPSALGSHSSPYIDLTVAGATVTHDGVIFAAGVGPAGTGQFDPFLTVSPGGSTPTEVGYNSDAQGAGATDDVVFYGGGRTHTLNASAIPPTIVGSTEYREFSLDGNDQGSDDFMSIEKIEIYIDTQAGIKDYTDGAGCTPGSFGVDAAPAATQIYCLDASTDETILMRTQGLSSGSGQSDITVLIPSSIFPAECFYGAIGCTKWVTFWFEAGFTGSLSAGTGCLTQPCNYDVTAGFEEWRTRKLPVVNVTKTANVSLDRLYDWTVKKYVSTDDTCAGGFFDAQTSSVADALNISLFNGQSDTVCWKIEPDRGDPVDSNQQLTGTITITNPTGDPNGNDPPPQVIPPIDAVINSVSDLVTQVGSSPADTLNCGVTFPHTLDPQETLNCTYSEALSSSSPGTNTATVNLDFGDAPDVPYSSPAMAFNPAAGTINAIDESAELDDDRKPTGFPQTFNDTDPNLTPITYTESLSCPASRTESNVADLEELDTNVHRTDPAFVNITCSKRDSSTVTEIHLADESVVTLPIALGSTVHDQATVTGAGPTPTGDVTFTFFTAASNCTGDSVAAGVVALVAGLAHPSDAFGPLAAGSYSFRASYAGDSIYNGSTSLCEPFTVNKADPTNVTEIHNDTTEAVVTTVALGTSVHDQATVTGIPAFDPTGSVTFTFFTTADDCTGASGAAGVVALAAGVAHPSQTRGPLAAGSYSFQASYPGDSNYNAVTSACEPLTVNKATPTNVTEIHLDNEDVVSAAIALGSTVHDKATVTGIPAFDPTGNVSFTFFTTADDCTGASGAAGVVALAAGVAHPSDSRGPLAAGSYSFQASYPGDSNYNAVTSACEPLTVNKATPTNVTDIHNDITHAVVTTVALGTTVHDKATVTGIPAFDPTGSVTFTFFTTADDCTGASGAAGVVALAAGVAHPSDSRGPLAAGSYSFRAHYPGDSNYNAVTSACEPLTVNKANTTTATDIHDAGHNVVTSVPAGSTVHDRATVTDLVDGFAPTGDVTFTFFTTASNCTGASIAAGTVALVGGVAHPSDAQGPLAAGSYSFQATYAGDGNFNGSTGACEPLEVTPVGEGCTPGYWKSHVDSWGPTGYLTTQTLESVFDVPDAFGLDTVSLLDALSLQGGSGPSGAAQILLRAAVAALLNAAHPGVNYPLSEAQIISQVNTALAASRPAMLTLATTLDTNNNLGCPLN